MRVACRLHPPGVSAYGWPRTSALVVAQSAPIRESLLVLLRDIPRIKAFHQAEDSPSALVMGAEIQPALVLLDYDSTPKEVAWDPIQLRAAWPRAQ